MNSSDLRGHEDGHDLLRTELPSFDAYGLHYAIQVCSSLWPSMQFAGPLLMLQNYPFDMQMKPTKAHKNLRLPCIILQKQQVSYPYLFGPLL